LAYWLAGWSSLAVVGVAPAVGAQPPEQPGIQTAPETPAAARAAQPALKPGARPPKPRPARPLSSAELADLRGKLLGDDLAAATQAARRLGESGARNASGPLGELLAIGTIPSLAVEALAALEKLRDPKSLQILTLYSGNRNAPVRIAAVKALAAIPDSRAAGVLIERLGDSAAEVRTAAAQAVAARKERRAADRLFKLVARNDAGAAGPLGTLIAPDDVPRLAELRGRTDDAVLADALGEFLKRTDVPDRLRVDVVRTLARMPGAAATTALVEYLASVPEKDPRASREEAQKIVDSRGPL
jgi:HEAT repeat protein